MRTSWKIGRVAGIDLFLHPTFLILLAFVGLGGGGMPNVALTMAAFGCVLLHELGHALTARQFGIATEDITLYPIGGVARLRRLPKAPGAELLIALAGPAVNLAIVAVLLMLLPGGRFIQNLIVANCYLALFNLIPAFPMDGGRVLRALLTLPMGRPRATEVAANLGQALAIAFPLISLGFGFFSVMHLFLAGFLYLAAGGELQQVRDEARGRDDDDDHGIWHAPPGYRWVDRGRGAWQLAPIAVVNPARDPRWRG